MPIKLEDVEKVASLAKVEFSLEEKQNENFSYDIDGQCYSNRTT